MTSRLPTLPSTAASALLAPSSRHDHVREAAGAAGARLTERLTLAGPEAEGRIVIEYRGGLPAAAVERLQRLYEESPYHVILTRGARFAPVIVARSWDHELVCDDVSAEALDAVRAFRDAFRDTAPHVTP